MPLSRPLPRTQKLGLALGLVALLLAFAIICIAWYTHTHQPVLQKINYTELRQLSDAATAKSLIVDGELITVVKQDGTLAQAVVTNSVAQQEIINAFDHQHVPIEFRSLEPGLLSATLNWVITGLMLAILGFVGWRVYASMGGGQGSFPLADAQGQQPVTFDEVAGVDEAKH